MIHSLFPVVFGTGSLDDISFICIILFNNFDWAFIADKPDSVSVPSKDSGRSSAWLERYVRDVEVARSNRVAPIFLIDHYTKMLRIYTFMLCFF